MLQTSLALLVFLLPLAYSPGPGNMFFAATGARFGLRATLRASAGYHLATGCVTIAIGAGFGAALLHAPLAFAAMKLVGALYVLWMAWRLLNARAGHVAARCAAPGARDGAVLLLVNPKAYMIIALMFTQFLDRMAGQTTAPVLLITAIFTLNNFLAFLLWSAIGDRLAAAWSSPRLAPTLDKVFAGTLALVALWMLLG